MILFFHKNYFVNVTKNIYKLKNFEEQKGHKITPNVVTIT